MVVSGLGLGVGPDSSRAPSFGSCNNLSGFPCLWIEHNGRTFLPECREDKPRRIMAHAARSLNVSACCEPFRVAVWRLRHREVPQHPQKMGMAGPELEVQAADTWRSIINKDDDPGCLCFSGPLPGSPLLWDTGERTPQPVRGSALSDTWQKLEE